MRVIKCDICGREMPMIGNRYKVIFTSPFFEQNMDICTECIETLKQMKRKNEEKKQ